MHAKTHQLSPASARVMLSDQPCYFSIFGPFLVQNNTTKAKYKQFCFKGEVWDFEATMLQRVVGTLCAALPGCG